MDICLNLPCSHYDNTSWETCSIDFSNAFVQAKLKEPHLDSPILWIQDSWPSKDLPLFDTFPIWNQ
jgi:hypothetical protein